MSQVFQSLAAYTVPLPTGSDSPAVVETPKTPVPENIANMTKSFIEAFDTLMNSRGAVASVTDNSGNIEGDVSYRGKIVYTDSQLFRYTIDVGSMGYSYEPLPYVVNNFSMESVFGERFISEYLDCSDRSFNRQRAKMLAILVMVEALNPAEIPIGPEGAANPLPVYSLVPAETASEGAPKFVFKEQRKPGSSPILACTAAALDPVEWVYEGTRPVRITNKQGKATTIATGDSFKTIPGTVTQIVTFDGNFPVISTRLVPILSASKKKSDSKPIEFVTVRDSGTGKKRKVYLSKVTLVEPLAEKDIKVGGKLTFKTKSGEYTGTVVTSSVSVSYGIQPATASVTAERRKAHVAKTGDFKPTDYDWFEYKLANKTRVKSNIGGKVLELGKGHRFGTRPHGTSKFQVITVDEKGDPAIKMTMGPKSYGLLISKSDRVKGASKK